MAGLYINRTKETANEYSYEHCTPWPSPEAVYIHIPFCTNKCFYCDFNSYVLKDQPVMDYLHALDREMELTVQHTPPV